MIGQHPLTDDIIHTMWGKGDPSQKFEYRLARAAADWQLQKVIEWLRSVPPRQYLILWDCDNQVDKDELITDLKKAMRPQEDN